MSSRAEAASEGSDPISTRPVDLDELALLEEERDHLLASLRDLEREHDAGDMDDRDYEALKDDYTVRAAEVLRAIEEGTARIHRSRESRSKGRLVLVGGAVVVFAVVAGIMVATLSGQRGDNAITGSSGTLREQLATCQTLSFQKPADGVKCYDKILDKAPDNVEALTYQGWAMVRSDRVADAGENFTRAVSLDPKYPDVRVFMAVVAKQAGDLQKAAEEVSIFYANDPTPVAVQVLQTQGLEREIFFGLLDPHVTACWTAAAAGQKDQSQLDAAFYTDLGACLDEVLKSQPNSTDALVSRALSLVGTSPPDTTGANKLIEGALGSDPSDTNALLMRASLRAATGDVAGARSDLKTLKGLARPTISFLIGGPDDVAAALDQLTANASVSTTTTPLSGGDPTRPVDSPQIPNRSGG